MLNATAVADTLVMSHQLEVHVGKPNRNSLVTTIHLLYTEAVLIEHRFFDLAFITQNKRNFITTD